MKQIIGLWNNYRSGEVARFLESFLGGTQFITLLEKMEKEKGGRVFIQSLLEGFDLAPNVILYLRGPEGEKEEAFVDSITGWLDGQGTTFLKECFLKTRMTLFHSPLEQILKKEFGFGIEYKVLVRERSA